MGIFPGHTEFWSACDLCVWM